MKRRFGRIPSPFDTRDYNLRNYIPYGAPLSAEPIANKKWDFPLPALDQEDTFHCVGFDMAGFGISLPTFTPYTNEDGHEFYYMCKNLEGDPDGEMGCFMRSGAQVLLNLGIIEAYAFAPDLSTILWWLTNKSPLMVGTIWTAEMSEPDIYNIVHPNGNVLGHHAYLLNGVIEEYLTFKNSWGYEYGDNGEARILISDFEKIFASDGEAITTVELEPDDGEPVIVEPPQLVPDPADNPGCTSLFGRKNDTGN